MLFIAKYFENTTSKTTWNCIMFYIYNIFAKPGHSWSHCWALFWNFRGDIWVFFIGEKHW